MSAPRRMITLKWKRRSCTDTTSSKLIILQITYCGTITTTICLLLGICLVWLLYSTGSCGVYVTRRTSASLLQLKLCMLEIVHKITTEFALLLHCCAILSNSAGMI
jgi:hypothetical protein